MKDRYEEALTLARQGKSIEEIFPELAESEDERIRKYFIWIVKNVLNNIQVLKLSKEQTKELIDNYSGIKQSDMIAYLEKQKEQKPDDDPLNDPKFLKGFDTGREVQRIFDEKKPAEKQDYSGLNDLERAILRGFLAACVDNVPVGIIKETAQECLAQMTPAEWSEEDEKMLNNLIWAVHMKSISPCDEMDDRNVYEKYENFLKSLRPDCYKNCNSRWKPSAEQMDALKYFVNHHQGLANQLTTKWDDFEELKSLYEDLKHLYINSKKWKR